MSKFILSIGAEVLRYRVFLLVTFTLMFFNSIPARANSENQKYYSEKGKRYLFPVGITLSKSANDSRLDFGLEGTGLVFPAQRIFQINSDDFKARFGLGLSSGLTSDSHKYIEAEIALALYKESIGHSFGYYSGAFLTGGYGPFFKAGRHGQQTTLSVTLNFFFFYLPTYYYRTFRFDDGQITSEAGLMLKLANF